MNCYRVVYYFRFSNRKREYQGAVCGCERAESREAAKTTITQADMSEGNTLTRVVASRRPKDHYCTESESDNA